MAAIPERNRLMASALILLMATSFSTGSLTQSRSQNRQFQRAVKNDKIIFLLEGVRERALNSVKPDPILLINFPEIDQQFKVTTGQKIVVVTLPTNYSRHFQIHLIEDTNAVKFAIHRIDEIWSEDIVVPELKDRSTFEEDEKDHLVVEITTVQSGSEIAVFFGCNPKGRIHMPYSLRDMLEKVKTSKVKVYHGEDLDFSVHAKESTESVLGELNCPTETMQAQEAANRGRGGGGGGGDLYSYRRGDIPIFNFDNADRILIATLQELIEALRKLKEETNNHRRETTALKKALQECKACRIKRPECSDDPGPCFPGVDCRDTADGPVCGPCPPGYDGDGRFCERNVCAEQPCFRGVQCFDSADPPYFRCGPCPPGYRGDGVACMPDPCQAKPAPCFRVRSISELWTHLLTSVHSVCTVVHLLAFLKNILFDGLSRGLR